MDQRTDLDLLKAIQESADRTALAALYDRYGRKVFALAYGILRSKPDAEDIVQEVFERVWKKSHTFQSTLGEAKYWMLRIAHNRAVNLLRSRTLRSAPATGGDIMSYVAEEVAAEEATLDFDTGELLRSSLSNLPEDQRKLIELAFFKGLSHSEIAEKERLPLGTVKTRIRNGIQRMRSELQYLKK
jgi:RNA polymerase sigma-70 factor (ECF subfamily)